MRKAKFLRFWVIRDWDNKLYCSNQKPYKNYRSECKDDYEWFTQGDFFEINSNDFDDLKPTDEPVEAEIRKLAKDIANH